MYTQLTRGMSRRLMYVENKNGFIDGARARIGWVSFSRTGQTAYFHGRTLQKGKGIAGNFWDVETADEYWLSGVKRRGSNAHPHESGVVITVDEDAAAAYQELRSR